MTALFRNCFILAFMIKVLEVLLVVVLVFERSSQISVHQSQSQLNTECSKQCESGFRCSWVIMVTGERTQSCVSLHSKGSPVLSRSRLFSALSRLTKKTDVPDRTRQLEYDRLRKALGNALQHIYQGVRPKNNTTTIRPTVRLGESNATSGGGTGCKLCTDNSQCTVSGEYCYHSSTCAMSICQPL